MSEDKRIVLGKMLAEMLGAAFIEVEAKPGQSFDDAMAEAAAKHRETCDNCMAEYQAEQAAEKAKASADADVGVNKDTRTPIGFMAFHVFVDKDPIPFSGTFGTTKAAVEAKVAKFKADPLVGALLNIGMPLNIGILPIYL